jgi:hypothetical protein
MLRLSGQGARRERLPISVCVLMADTSRLNWLTLRCWLDEDGEHVWQSHVCKDGQRVTSILPRGPWRADAKGDVTPSINCHGCGLHTFGRIEPKPEGL